MPRYVPTKRRRTPTRWSCYAEETWPQRCGTISLAGEMKKTYVQGQDLSLAGRPFAEEGAAARRESS